jgi:hypothetical protein
MVDSSRWFLSSSLHLPQPAVRAAFLNSVLMVPTMVYSTPKGQKYKPLIDFLASFLIILVVSNLSYLAQVAMPKIL